MTDDLELRKRIAEAAQLGSATDAPPAVRAFQFFLVPLLIVGACVGVYALLTYVVAHPRTAESWLVDLQEGGPNSRPHAALQLAQALRRMETPDRSLTPRLMAIYGSLSPDEHEVRQYVAMCLGYLRDPAATSLLVEGARSGSEEVKTRAACMEALGAIKDPATLPELVKLLDDPNPVVRKYAAFNAGAAAEGAGDAGVAEALRRLLADPVPDVTWNAAFALAYFLNDGSGADTLKKMLDRKYLEGAIGSDPEAELLASRALFTACNAAAKLGDAEFLPALRRLTDAEVEPDPDVRYTAHRAVALLEGK